MIPSFHAAVYGLRVPTGGMAVPARLPGEHSVRLLTCIDFL